MTEARCSGDAAGDSRMQAEPVQCLPVGPQRKAHKTHTTPSATCYLQKQSVLYIACPQLLLNEIQDTPLLFLFFHLLFSTGHR